MIEDIKAPADVSKLITIQHTNDERCPACRRRDRSKVSTARLRATISQHGINQDALAHCKHPQTRTILMQRVVEDERGFTLEHPADAEQCIGCGRVLWEQAL